MSHTYMTPEETLSLRKTRSKRSAGIAAILFGFVAVMYIVSMDHIKREMGGAASTAKIEQTQPMLEAKD